MRKSMDEIAKSFASLFEGYGNAYGTFKVTTTREHDQKKKGIAKLIKEPVELYLWIHHLEGRQSLGIVPIRADNMCVFGAIDIDVYPINIGEVLQKVSENNFPLVATTTKSGGLHLWLFTEKPVPAELMQKKLRDMAAILGFGTSEIFPKQTVVLTERGDVGSWINMPYFDHENTNRHGVYIDGSVLTAEEFLEHANESKVSEEVLEKYCTEEVKLLDQGPPCLQLLAKQGFPSGTRNIGLYNLGVYAKKKDPDNFEAQVEQYNIKFMDPPLGTSEVKTLIQSLKKKDYQFQCKVQPLQGHCNSAVCRGRKYGVGNHQGMPVITSLTKYNTEPPIWFVDVEGGGRVELTTDDLQNPRGFQKRCIDTLNSMPPLMKLDSWHAMIQTLLENVNVIEAPEDSSPRGLLLEHIEKFCTQRAQAKSRDEILLGKPFYESGFHYFRMIDLLAYLDRNKFKEFRQNHISNILKTELMAEHKFFVLKGKGCNCWGVPEYVRDDSPLELPSGVEKPPY